MMVRRLLLTSMIVLVAGCSPLEPFVSKPPMPANAAPAGAMKLNPAVPANIRAFAVSPDRRRIAYMTSNPIGQLHVVTIEEGDAMVADLQDDVEDLQWANNGESLVFQTVLREVIPGQYADWDVPATRIVSARLHRFRIGASAPDTLLETTDPVWFEAATAADAVFYGPVDPSSGSPTQIRAMDLATKEAKPLEARTTGLPLVSPDGKAIAWHDLSGEGVQVLELDTGKRNAVGGDLVNNFMWLGTDRLLVNARSGDQAGLRIAQYTRDGQRLSDVAIEGETYTTAPIGGKARGGGAVSPDGKWSLGAGKGKDPGTPIISLETGRVYYTRSFAWRGWLDETTLLGVFDDGLYTMPLAQAADFGDAELGK